jgi:hypothetical protein
VGSGLILFVIVGAWLAVLVPMALKSHDTSASLRSVDRFGDAMRVLSRRTPGDRREVVVPRGPFAPLDELALTPAERRRRTLLILVGLSLLTLGLGLLGSGLLVALHLVCDALLAAFVVHCRRQAVLRAARRRPAVAAAAAPVRAARPAARPAALRVRGIPERMPARPAPLTAPLPAPAARYDDAPVVVPAAAAATGTDDSWSPVPVPLPVYVGKPVAPARPPRVLDLTRPGEWTATLDDAGLDILDDGPELDEILDRRRVSGGW